MYNLVAENPESTVVAEYQPLYQKETAYQSEADLEKSLIEQLGMQAYEFLPITSEKQLIDNLRIQLQNLNDYVFTDKEWNVFFENKIANKNLGIEEKTAFIQEDHIQTLERNDGTFKNIYLIDKEDIHNNHLQVINQYTTETSLPLVGEVPVGGRGLRSTRYDVTILVNGLPLVHIELKRRGVDLKEAFNQINRYSRDSFWAGSGLFEYVQLFVISNGTYTKYYSNTTRFTHIKELETSKPSKGKRSSNSYEFTSWWADANNKPITDLMDFTKTFFAKHSILNVLTKYCVFTQDRMLLAMRPYQIVATERILARIKVATNYKNQGTIKAGGYIWHTTGSGKTLTSFKTAQIASKLPYVDKVLFVVDRKDLDYQTMKEYDKFEKGSANSNTSTAKLKKQLEDPTAKIIITTIQKLSILVGKHKKHAIYDSPIVIIFDECHRSQFGEMHIAIRKAFKNYYLFGFTGTPIFAKNASSGRRIDLSTTEQAFGDKLHTYTIVDAINDKNVLPFRIDYVSTMREDENIQDQDVYNIDREKALSSPKRISDIVTYIREHFDQKTKRNQFYKLKDRRLAGFNSIFAVSSIDVAKKYYTEFQKQMASLPSDQQLKVATIFSFAVNEDMDGILDDENMENTDNLDQSSRDFLDSAIQDYNRMFKTNYDTSSDKFQSYYKDVSQKVKDREIDLLIVVNMFLTGFDATTLNTLWVDKNLRLHGLLQAFSRTNRILNSVKTFGNIVCFRNLEDATNESIALFGDKEAGGVVLLKPFDDYYYGYIETDIEKGTKKEIPGYKDLVEELIEKFPVGQMIIGEQAQKEFIKLYGSILKFRNILSTFDEFIGKEILSERDVQDYHSMYINLYQEFRKKSQGDSENINDDIVFEMELIKQIEINIDYILELIRQYHDGNTADAEIIVKITKAVSSSVELRSKKDLIENFILSLTPEADVDEDWHSYVEKKKNEELEQIITDENLNRDEAIKFVNNAFRDGYIQETGTALSKVLPPVSRFTPSGERTMKRETVLTKIKEFFNRFFDIISQKSNTEDTSEQRVSGQSVSQPADIEQSVSGQMVSQPTEISALSANQPTFGTTDIPVCQSNNNDTSQNNETNNSENMKKYEHPLPDANRVDDLFLNSPNYYTMTQTDEPPTKENSLYLTIDQYWFDEIVSGRKEIEYREVKKSTMSRFLQLPKKKSDQYFIHELLPEDAPIGINEYNEGIFCFLPREYKYLNLAVGYNKDRDTATLRLKGACFMPARMPDGRILKYKYGVEVEVPENATAEEYDEAHYNENGDITIWIIGYEIGEVVELNKK